MPLSVPVPTLAVDPGYLLWAPLGTAEPTHTVTGGVFSDDWTLTTGWVVLGATPEGHSFSWSTSTETIDVAEFLDPLKYVETGRSGSFSFALADVKMSNLKRALNGGTVTATGTGATSMATYTPAGLGASVRCMIGWESQDHTERLIGYQCFNTGAVEIARRKGTDYARIPVEFALEVPVGGQPFKYLTAGAARSA
jgi:hypothetical protein